MAFPTTEQGFGPISGEGGGNGDFNRKNYPIGLPSTPTLSILAGSQTAKGVHAYAISEENLHYIVRDLYADGFWDAIESNKYNPLSGILGSFYLPNLDISSSSTLETVISHRVVINNHEWGAETIPTDTAPSYPELTKQYYWKHFDTITIDEYFGSFLDYAPHTKIQVYLPFIGIQEIPVNLCMGGSIKLDYLINAINGNCVAYLTFTDRNERTKTINSATGNCAIQLPITGFTDMTAVNVVSGLASTAATLGGLAVGGYLGAMAANAAVNVAEANLGGTVSSNMGYLQNSPGDIPGAVSREVNAASAAVDSANRGAVAQRAQTGAGIASASINAATSIAGAFATPVSTGMVGAVSGGMGIMNQLMPYVMIFRPVPCTPYDYNHYFGRPSNITGNISDFTNFNIFGAVSAEDLDNLTSKEKDELISILKTGVILPDTART